MSIYIETAFESLNKFGEELCGDKVEILKSADSVIIVLADGLGSGVKANILATLTSKIIASMLGAGAEIEECVETIASTLPVCHERGIAYSTFSILQIRYSGEVYLIEFDNPSVIYIKNQKIAPVERKIRSIGDKEIGESRFSIDPGDMLLLFSDGVVHAGVGKLLNLGWQYENIEEYVGKAVKNDTTARTLARQLVSACDCLYLQKPGDDTTVVAVRVCRPLEVCVMVGPPVDPSLDQEVVDKLMACPGKRVACGGTTSQIVSRITGKELKVSFEYYNAAVPPTGSIEGLDLATEGVLTLGRALDLVKAYGAPGTQNGESLNLQKKDGGTRLARLLLEESTRVCFLVGRAMNPAHQNPDLPISLSLKLKLVEELAQELEKMGKDVFVEYY